MSLIIDRLLHRSHSPGGPQSVAHWLDLAKSRTSGRHSTDSPWSEGHRGSRALTNITKIDQLLWQIYNEDLASFDEVTYRLSCSMIKTFFSNTISRKLITLANESNPAQSGWINRETNRVVYSMFLGAFLATCDVIGEPEGLAELTEKFREGVEILCRDASDDINVLLEADDDQRLRTRLIALAGTHSLDRLPTLKAFVNNNLTIH